MPALAAMLACTVIGIADGDTLTARCDAPDGKVNIKVRMAEIDAPEKGQAWGNRSKQHLAALCFEQPAIMRPQTVPGVSFLTSARQPDGIWQARLKLDGGQTRTKSFSVRLHGERRAFELAVKARRGMLADAEDRPFVHYPVARRASRNPR